VYDANFLPNKKNSPTIGPEMAGANTPLADFLHEATAVLKIQNEND
jgi:hypothetical protein